MNRTWASLALSLGLGLGHAASAEERPLAGDTTNGARRFRLDCAACHGRAGEGDGPLAAHLKPAIVNLRDGGVLFGRTDNDFIAALLQNTGMPAGAFKHGDNLTTLDAHDILAWLKETVPEPGSFFPNASEYIAHKQTIDKYGLERVKKALGEPLDAADQSLLVFTMFKPEDGQTNPNPNHAVKTPEDNAAIYALKPKRRLGFVTYVPLELDGGTTIQVAIAVDRTMLVTAVESIPTADEKAEKLRLKLDPILRAYVGAGGRVAKHPVEPQKKGLKAPKDLQRAMAKAYQRIIESAAMFEKEERDRFALEPEVFNTGASDEQPEDVKIDVKNQKVK